MYNTDGKYSPYSSLTTFWMVFWAVQAAWVALFPGFVCKAIFGKRKSGAFSYQSTHLNKFLNNMNMLHVPQNLPLQAAA